MRTLVILAVLAAALSASAAPGRSSDDAESRQQTLAYLVAGYYATNETWPATAQQLRAFSLKHASGRDLWFSRSGMRQYWRSISAVEFTARGKNLLVCARLRSSAGESELRATFRPGRSVDEIVHGVTLQ
jgi:hypothetical protein